MINPILLDQPLPKCKVYEDQCGSYQWWDNDNCESNAALEDRSSRAVPRRAFTNYFPTLNTRSNCLRLDPLAVWRRWNMLNPGKPLLSNWLLYVWWGFQKNWLQVCRMCTVQLKSVLYLFALASSTNQWHTREWCQWGYIHSSKLQMTLKCDVISIEYLPCITKSLATILREGLFDRPKTISPQSHHIRSNIITLSAHST